MEARFADNLYEGIGGACAGGCGQIAFCDAGAWIYERHARICKPGLWSVGITASHAGEFYWLLTGRMDAVVDDFGNLRRVQGATNG